MMEFGSAKLGDYFCLGACIVACEGSMFTSLSGKEKKLF
jgi:hypothetical protein